MTRRRAAGGTVVLLSGGMDSGTCLAIAASERRPLYALTVRYGQRHHREIRAARELARRYRVRDHAIVALPVGPLLSSSLTDRRRAVPSRGTPAGRIPSTYVPARNTILLAVALGYAESRGADTIMIGANAIDYSGYPDCRPEFLRAFERLARLATKAGVERTTHFRIRAPLLRKSKAQIVRWGERLRVPWRATWSCYLGRARPCGRCDACRLRALGFAEAGVRDPLVTAV